MATTTRLVPLSCWRGHRARAGDRCALRGKQDAARPLSCDKQVGASSLRSVTTAAGFDAFQNAVTVRFEARDTGRGHRRRARRDRLKGASRIGLNPSYDVPNNRTWRSLLRAHSWAWRSLRRYCSSVECESELVAQEDCRTSSIPVVRRSTRETLATRRREERAGSVPAARPSGEPHGKDQRVT
jgi:hypothetical protein